MLLTVNALLLVIWSLAYLKFRSGDLDWLIIFYGCAPPKERLKYNSTKIRSIASNMMIPAILITVAKLTLELFWPLTFWVLYGCLILIIFILVYVLSFIFGKERT